MSANNLPYRILVAIQQFLATIHYDQYVLLIPILLLAICSLSWLICTVMMILTPFHFGSEHRRASLRTASICFWGSLLIHILFRLWGSNEQMNMLRQTDLFAFLVFAGLALLNFLAAAVVMIFKRKGTRVFSSRSLTKNGLRLSGMTLTIGLIGCFVMQS